MARRNVSAVSSATRKEVRSHWGVALAGIGAGALCNYWVLEGLLSERSDSAASWISDLATRTEGTGWRFAALGILSGLAIAGFALLLAPRLGELSATARRGARALFAAGALAALASASPLSCPEGLEASCSLAYDPLDLIHATATLAESVATGLAFLLIGLGLRPRRAWSRAGEATLALGGVWLVLTLLTTLTYVGGEVDSFKGLLQRAAQLLFGAWLALLGAWLARERA